MTVPVLAQIESAVEQAERLSGQNDRVLFLLTLILFFVAGGVAVRWFMSQLEKRDKRIEDMQTSHATEIAQLHKEIGQVRAEFNTYLMAAATEMHSTIARNTDAMERNSKVIQDNSDLTERKMHVLGNLETLLKATPVAGTTR